MIVAIAMVPLLGMMALAFDVSRVYYEHRSAQNAADAAAWAAALDLEAGRTSSQATATATEYATRNGYTTGTAGGSTTTVTAASPPTSGSRAGQSGYVQVIISKQFPTFLAKLFGQNSLTTQAKATGGLESGGGNVSILALDGSASRAWNMSGTGNWTFNNGAKMQINSNASSDAGRRTGNASVTFNGGGKLQHTGGIVSTGSGDISDDTTHPPIADFIAAQNLTLPTCTGPGPSGTPTPPGTAAAPQLFDINGSGNYTINPGNYYGGIKYSGSGSLTLNPGIYVLCGGGFRYSGSGDIIANGVFIYNTENSPTNTAGAGAYGAFEATGSGDFTFTPMTSGTYKNLAFYQPAGNTNEFKVSGSANVANGTIYLPGAKLNWGGSADLVANFQIIAKTLEWNGSGNVTNNFNPEGVFTVSRAALVE